MALIEFIGHLLEQVDEETQASLKGMTLEQILWRPTEESNPMAWLAWHIARTQDLRSSHLLGRDQIWNADGWHARFGLPADPANTGRGNNDADVSALQPESVEAVATYCALASGRLREYVGALGPGAESDVIDNPEGGQTPLGAVLNRMVHGGLTHVGQLMYVRGLIERRHWFSR
ncbi:MAG: DinB family protein [Chloroflexi bacterium]|nr:DinB family protein [Chloroflexota bacterium]